MQAAHTEQFAEIRDNPLVAGFDEPVVEQPRDVIFDDRSLFRQDRDQRLQRLALIDIANAVNRRQQRVDFFRCDGTHDVRSERLIPSGSIRISSAPLISWPSQCAVRAGIVARWLGAWPSSRSRSMATT